MAPFTILVAFAFLLALAATPMCRRLALRHGVVARHNHRTVHTGRVPKLGGGAIFAAVVVPLVVMAATGHPLSREVIGLLLGGTVLFLVGAADDVRGLGCNFKLALQSFGALVLVWSGFRIEVIVLPGFGSFPLGWGSIPFTLLWVVGITNAINLIDGLDGLATGVVMSAVAVAAVLGCAHGHALVVLVAAVVFGALAGFLPYNLHPAAIFMGDSGSLFLGFVVAWLAAAGAQLEPGTVPIAVPLLSLLLPVTDTSLAIIRRLRRGIHPFVADREHIHHRLLNAGLSHGNATLLMCAVSLALAGAALLLAGLGAKWLPPLCSLCLSQ
ncbi:MAG: undecaprenyl/decaprenyl-phosphate alpha-N-acetylglucosaminyl 1-phosphate transferase [candidate division KSB1 bacterium]|nr:undecaprenyl/decaprenyl-phosphate alpha-N-acetylglucosaminyl 1-phosphate transferase [candidate division KSB1 bacterium]MDZ7293870.1 undecaprenyl/decaprenyl-phosphate alpha-N-acetylglucosaminyl 1-phosphate transferase [candidate division KSB1 bacterium]MDZ7385687.1 undecaprenyl/decaprenyl-phosphate alpha-N-acetylglucosaminyl 1-phosphate transferase [candidate division KSB1 bacterium]MDZ7391604.1 undecaprenyl/decaprenyl-phosphate alpha-N-acetylglucosaminyl 1-phosphate transferase [candidate di